ncbi:short chain dehydrogenase/reductase family [Cladophialophora carrionii]|uniref:Short chain dehydrogenase/reductase family n=1 Tax=Cladophialophora carrionii TaxID=86049 RepID=A0A1C1C976_9EURO|nr:short chain dehydrogenase/reductase family [Cladophialophora carrionii]
MSAADTAPIQAANLFNVNGLVAVVTGAGSGLGRMMARALAANGASKVFIIGRRESNLKETADSVPGGTIIPLVGDVTSKPSLQQCFEKVKAQVDHIDVLIANSGISGPPVPTLDKDQKPVSIEELAQNMWKPEPEEVNSTYAVNLTGIHFTVAAFLPLLDAANKKRPAPNQDNFTPRPQIITTASIGGYNRKALGNFSYGPSKAAAVHLTKQLTTALVPYDIRANVIAPGLYYSEMTHGMYAAQGKTEIHNIEGAFGKDVVPATRTGDEQDMAGVILWLCSRAGAYINGCVVVTDGGRLGVVPSSY